MNTAAIRAPRTLAAALIALVLGVGIGGCSGGKEAASAKTPEAALKAMGISDPVDLVVASAVERLDPGSAIGDELGRTYLQLKYAQEGYAWADAGCAVDAVVATVGADNFGTAPIGRLDDVLYDHPDLQVTMRDCASTDSLARLDAPKPTLSATTTAPTELAHAAPDIDGAAVGAMVEAFVRIGADRIGLTSSETTCVVGVVVGDRDAKAFADLAVGRNRIDVEKTARGVGACVENDHLPIVAAAAGKALIAAKKSAAVEHDRVQALLKARANAAPGTATTVVVGG